MPHVRDQYTTLKTLLNDHTAFTTPIDWVSNGERGYKHATGGMCQKFRPSSNRVVVQASPDDIVNARFCPDCFIPTVLRRVPGPRHAVEALLRVATDMSTQQSLLNDAADPTRIARIIATLKAHLRTLVDLNEDPAILSAYGPRMEELTRTATALRSRARTMLAAHQPAIMSAAALALMTPMARRDDELLATDDEALILGDRSRYSGSHVHAVFQVWHDARQRGLSDEERCQRLAKAGADVRLVTIEQLKGVPVRASNPGEDQFTAASTAWAQARDELVQTLGKRWDARYAALLSDDREVTVAVFPNVYHSVHSYDVMQQAFEGFVAGERWDGRAFAVRVPHVVALLVLNRMDEVTRARQCRAQTWDGVLDETVLSTALELWDPETASSPYVTFSEAVRAAVNLM